MALIYVYIGMDCIQSMIKFENSRQSFEVSLASSCSCDWIRFFDGQLECWVANISWNILQNTSKDTWNCWDYSLEYICHMNYCADDWNLLTGAHRRRIKELMRVQKKRLYTQSIKGNCLHSKRESKPISAGSAMRCRQSECIKNRLVRLRHPNEIWIKL